MDPRLHPDGFWQRLTAALETVPEERRTAPAHARVGAVLVLLEDTRSGPSVVLTRRRLDMRSHPGQISFPGGRVDPGETVEIAALREAYEEIHLDRSTVEVIGAGPRFYIPPSRFWVVPVLARWHAPHPLKENPWEVDEVLHVPISTLLDRDRWRHTPISRGGSAWAWELDEDLLWGATASVMATLLDVAVEDWNGGLKPHELGEARAVRPWERIPSWERRPRLVGDLPHLGQDDLPHVSAEVVRRARRWGDDRGLTAAVRAEHAGRALAHTVRRLLGTSLRGVTVTVLAGPSNNGAGGLSAARLLAIAGASVRVLLVGQPRLPHQLELLHELQIPTTAASTTDDWNKLEHPGQVVIDAMLGIGAQPPLARAPAAAATWLSHYDVLVVSLDLPSGVGPDLGLQGSCVTADVTVAMGRPSHATRQPVVQAYLGDLYLADVGLPDQAWEQAGAEPAPRGIFAEGPLVRLTEPSRPNNDGTSDRSVSDDPGEIATE